MQKHGVTNPQLCKSGKLHTGQNQEQTVISPAAAWASVAKKCCHGWSAKILYHQMLYRVSFVINALFYHGLDIFHTHNIYYIGLKVVWGHFSVQNPNRYAFCTFLVESYIEFLNTIIVVASHTTHVKQVHGWIINQTKGRTDKTHALTVLACGTQFKDSLSNLLTQHTI